MIACWKFNGSSGGLIVRQLLRLLPMLLAQLQFFLEQLKSVCVKGVAQPCAWNAGESVRGFARGRIIIGDRCTMVQTSMETFG